ncbi:MAG: hypothetical protein WC067_00705 [Candidatus Methanomethylophilaceae archaeon]
MPSPKKGLDNHGVIVTVDAKVGFYSEPTDEKSDDHHLKCPE